MPAARNSLIDEAMAAARSISKEHPSRARAMITIGLAVQDVAPLVPEIMEGASASIMMYGVVDDLCALVPKLPEAALEQVLSLARRKPYWNAVDILTALLPRLPERLVPQALDIAHEYDDEFWRAMAIASVAGRLPEPAKETELRLAYRLSVGLPPEHRAMILSKVAENARESDRLSRWGQALEQACEAADLPFDEDRPFEETIKVFTSMIPRLPQSLKETVLERSSSFPPGLREQVLVTLIPELDEILMTQTLEVCRHFHGYEWEQAQALMTIAERLRPLPWQRILAIANRMEDAFEQTRVITALAARSDGARRKFLVAKAKQHSGRISNGWKRASALASLSRLVSQRRLRD
jgi:hypothetical protein